MDDFSHFIWDVIPTPFTNSIILQDGYCNANQYIYRWIDGWMDEWIEIQIEIDCVYIYIYSCVEYTVVDM